MLKHSFRGGEGSGPRLLNPSVWFLREFKASQKSIEKHKAKTQEKSEKIPPQGIKMRAKMILKVDSGRCIFDFCSTLFSCKPTKVLLDFHGFGVPRDSQKTIKKRVRNMNVEKRHPKTDFFTKKIENVTFNEVRLGPRIRPQLAPEGQIFQLWAPWRQKGAQVCQKAARRQ